MVKVIDTVALTIEDPHDFIAHHERNCQFRARSLCGTNVAWVLAYVGGIYRLLLQDRCAGDSLMALQTNRILAGIPADLRTNAQLPGLLVEQQDRHVPQLKEVASDGEDSLQHLVQIKGGEHGLARVKQDCEFRHGRSNCTNEDSGYQGSESNPFRGDAIKQSARLLPLSHSADQPVDDHAKEEIQKGAQVQMKGVMPCCGR